MIMSVVQTGILLYIVGWALRTPELSLALGAEIPSFHIGMLAFGLLYSPVSTLLGIAMNYLSRKNEYEADNYAKNTYSSEPLISSLKKLSTKHLSNLNPHPAYVFCYYSHPPLLQRMGNLEK